MEFFQEVICLDLVLLDLSGVVGADQRLKLVFFFTKGIDLSLDLGLEHLVFLADLVELLLEVDFVLVQPLLIRVLHALWHVRPLILILLCLLKCKICNALKLSRRLHLVFGG